MKSKLRILLIIVTMVFIITTDTNDTDNNSFLYQNIAEECFGDREGTMIVFNPQNGVIYGIVNRNIAKDKPEFDSHR